MSANPILLNPCREQDLSVEAALVRDALIRNNLETPMVETGLSGEQKCERIELLMTQAIETLGLDLGDDSLRDTPRRIAKMYVNEIFSGLDYRHFPRLSAIDNKFGTDEMIQVNDIEFTSTCEHHFVTIDGHAKVAYVPERKVIGLSKINRIVRFFAQRPQVQERLTRQILVALQTVLETDDVGVSITATHFCVKSRGVMDSNSSTSTMAVGGTFRSCQHTRKAFMR